MKNITKANCLFFMVIAVNIALTFAISFAVSKGIRFDLFTLYVLPELAMMFPGLIYVTLLKADTAADALYARISLKVVFIVIIFTFALIPISAVINILTSFGNIEAGKSMAEQVENMPFWKMFIAIAIVPAVCEEFVFRGCIYGGLRKKSIPGAIIISSLMFGMVHLNINQFSYAFVLGIFFALMTEITGNILSSTIAHLIFNGTSVFMTYASKAVEESAAEYGGDTGTASLTQEGRIETILTLIFTMAFILGLAVLFIILCLRGLCDEYGKRGMIGKMFSRGKKETDGRIYGGGRFFDLFSISGIAMGILFIVMFDIL